MNITEEELKAITDVLDEAREVIEHYKEQQAVLVKLVLDLQERYDALWAWASEKYS